MRQIKLFTLLFLLLIIPSVLAYDNIATGCFRMQRPISLFLYCLS